ncbi:MAG: carbohydrate binding family 9 domain-containing protein [Bacteroidetes bacterium]|jgi:hypothetical protein|nr:carbohydrate binding family 9 domain-containing protein [Bacteroidota bacterium]
MNATVAACCLLTVGLLPLSAQSPVPAPHTKPIFTTTRVDRPVRLTGQMDDPLWATSETIDLAYEFQPGENTQAPVRTEVKSVYDADNLYIAVRCYDPRPDEIRANYSDRDRVYSDDFIVVIFDTYGDYQRGYELVVNPYGIQGDLMMSSGGEDMSFDMIWESAGSITSDGWIAEMAIPFKSLRFPDKDVQEWGFNVSRTYPRTSRTQMSWTPVDRNVPNFLTQLGTLQGLRDIRPGGSFELLPYVLGQQQGVRSDPSDPRSPITNSDLLGRVGTGVRYAPSSDFAADLVINPDFSQVESDADQIAVNTTFALYYQERRPFFLESTELLQTPMYYSRSINNPLVAGRVVGKSGGLSYMVVSALDRNSVIVVPGEESSSTVATSMRSAANVGRVRYDLGNEAYVGAMALSRNLTGSHNYVVGLDWNYRFWENWYFNGEGFLSQTKELADTTLLTTTRMFGSTGRSARLDGEQYSGAGLHLVLSRSARNFSFDAVYNDFSPTYQTYNGIFSSTNYRQFFLEPRYTFYFTESFVERLSLMMSGSVQHNYAGQRKEQAVQPAVNLRMKGQTFLFASYLLVNDELFQGVQFRNIRRGMIELNSQAFDALSFGLYGQIGRFIFRPAVEMGDGHNLGASMTIRPTSQIKVDVSYNRARLSSVATGALYYDGYVGRVVGIYQFTPEMFIRSIFQYNSFDRSFNVYPLFSYKLNALTTFYAGMTNNYLDFGLADGFTTTERQFFVKMQYLFRS